jgi:hypothetical protein
MINSKQLVVNEPNWARIRPLSSREPAILHGDEDAMMWRCEIKLEDMLADPIVRAVMQADGVDQRELDALLARVASARRAAGGRDNATDRRVD